MEKNRIKIVRKAGNPEISVRRVNTYGMWFGGFSAGSHSLLDIGEARTESDFKYVRKR